MPSQRKKKCSQHQRIDMYFPRDLPEVWAESSVAENINWHSGHGELETAPRVKKIFQKIK